MKYSNEKILEIVDHINQGVLDYDITRKCEVSRTLVWKIRNKKIHKELTDGILNPPPLVRTGMKVTPDMYPRIENDILSGMTYKQVAQKYHICRNTVSNIFNRSDLYILKNWEKAKCALTAELSAAP